MLACLLTSNFYQVHSRDSLLLLPVIWLPPPSLPCPCNISLHHWPQQPAFVLESSYWLCFAFLSFPFASSVLSGRLIAHSISCDLQCSRFFAPKNFFAPYQNSIHFITTSITPFACQQEFAQCKKGNKGEKHDLGTRSSAHL